MDGSACLNCGERGSGRFCPACGQARRSQPIPTVREWLGEALDELLMVEARLPRSVGALFWPPGELTRSWWEGRRSSFVSPFRLYLLFAVPFFFLASLRSDDGDPYRESFFEVVVAGVLYSSGDTALVVASDPIPPLPIELHDDSTARAEYRRQVEEKYASLRAREEAIGGRVSAGMRRVFDVLPIAVGIVMVPFLAIMLRIGTHGQTRFVAHLVFSLHLHAVVYAIAWLVGLSPGWAGFIGGGIFLGVARHRILEERWLAASAGALAIPTLYALVFVGTYIAVTLRLGRLGGDWLFGG